MRVMKFGGTSVGSPEALQATVAIVREASGAGPAIVVTSALSTVTDQLEEVIIRAIAREGDYGAIVERLRAAHRGHLRAVTGSEDFNGSGETIEKWLVRLSELLNGVALHGHCSARIHDEILGVGERLASPLLTEVLRHGGVDAQAVDAALLIRTDDSFGSGIVDTEITRSLTRGHLLCLRDGVVPVVTGFVAATARGELTTLGRGGSDYSAALLADSVDADVVEIWTDVDGVRSADPAVIPDALTIAHLTYGEATELARAGAKVLHHRTILPLFQGRIPVHIRNTRNRGGAWTLIDRVTDSVRSVKGIASRDQVCLLRAAGTVAEALRQLVDVTTDRYTVLRASHDDILVGLSSVDAARVLRRSRAWNRGQCGCASAVDALSIVTVVGDRIGIDGEIAARSLAAFRAAGIPACGVPFDSSRDSVAIAVHGQYRAAAICVLHDALVKGVRAVHLIIAGATGRVGSALCQQIAARPADEREGGLQLRVRGIANTSLSLFGASLDPSRIDALIGTGQQTDWPSALERIGNEKAARRVFVDCTASEEVARLYEQLLAKGIHVVTPNKIALAASASARGRLTNAGRGGGAKLLYETTVGAALPVLRTIRDLVATGDRIVSIHGVLSGTLSFIASRIHAGISFSSAVCEALGRGLTEPDPALDLSGVDVARKLLILVRESGGPLAGDRVVIRPLPGSGTRYEGNLPAYRRALEAFDDEWHSHAHAAEANGRRLVYAATFEEGSAGAGIEEMSEDSPLARARPGENVLIIRTERYGDVPLTISGPGAGPEVTAAGVLAEILSL